MFPKPWAYQGFTNDLWYIVCQPNWMEPSRHPLGPHYVQSIGAAEAVSLAIGHNAGRVVTLTQYTTMLVHCIGVGTRPELCPRAKETASAAPMLCTECSPNGWMDNLKGDVKHGTLWNLM